MQTRRSTAAERRAQTVAAGMRVFADHGLTTSAVQRIADEAGLSQPYVFRLFGSKHALFLACLDELEIRVRQVFSDAAAVPGDPLPAMGEGFRDLVADGVISGLWLQACTAARSDEAVAAHCRAILAGLLTDVQRTTRATPDALAQFLADGALVMLLQSLGMDLADGTRNAIGSLVNDRTTS